MKAAFVQWPPGFGKERFLSRKFPDRHTDLDIDFDMPRPALVTELLSRCLCRIDGKPIDAELLWHWTVSERLQGLLAIANASTGTTTAAVAICSKLDCRERIELELGLSGFADEEPIAHIDWLSPEGVKIPCRLPTGQDQLSWYTHAQGKNEVDEAWLAECLLESSAQTLLPTILPEVWTDSLGTALNAADPLTALNLDVSCPSCDQALRVDVDLEQLLLEGLRLQQRRLIEQVHRLACNYHWSEFDIAMLPSWRRERYLSRLAVEFE
ncbi:MAG: hypothetical protein ACREPB_12500 [Arenimonas sp.]